jgi:hypothetical protein
MERGEHIPENHNSQQPNPSKISELVRKNFYYRYGYHRTEFGRKLLRDKIRALSTIIDFRSSHPGLPDNGVLLHESRTEKAVVEKLVSLGNVIPFSELEKSIFGKGTPKFPEK